ncbi:hypothetical protein CEUSTIGMA_g74.t1 [Chlamydomonas eustigma]|uniref:Raptor N-terminal CASPase-like domain-containing protein n=1 Tax=Chlamydomonas eustigma TaxID=1157962 RepID=A0A250WP67_9CHLO|nr:hypothetical protein CEUSTIGMA_g74.t1 [Chlamydomonas eustigma]|eukprot:GAX72618.1 hypothetical protein CEUSTIGMA_g74.t1 [Chlamydomonas eustigma]
MEDIEPVDREVGESSAGLTDELSRRLTIKDVASSSATSGPHGEILNSQTVRLLCEERHSAGDENLDKRQLVNRVVSKWRQKEKLKTTAVALVLCLNIGVDPPDVIKISPCARLECWVDPMSMQPAKALETIGKNLQAQYERWQPKAKYKMHLDPTVDDVKKLCSTCRKAAKNERVLFHYNGHGVPRPTVNGEIWVFNSRYTQYIPLSIYELQSWLGNPCIYVLDCSAAGVIINAFRAFMDQRPQHGVAGLPAPHSTSQASATGGAADPLREVILLAACGASEVLPQNPDLPADVFTACLTTPIKVALRWFCSRSLLRQDGITKELIDRIPGRQTERKTPLGELNWIFTAITDTIAWNMLPKALFQKLFRSDLLVASLFRNFLLAERIMTTAGCSPVSYPRLPPTHSHPMWQAWDMAAEMCLMQLPTLLSDPGADFMPSPFFSEQLTAFELWLQHGSRDKKPPEQLPIVLQVLLSQVHRLRALVLLGRFLDMGPWAVDLALSVGIFPYVLKLLQTTSSDLRSTLVFIWCKILALDKSCQADLVKDNGHLYFIKHLDSNDGQVDSYSRAQACFVLCVICDAHPKGQALCAGSNLLAVLLKWVRSMFPPQVPFPSSGHALLLKWLCLCLGKLCQDMPEISLMAIREGAADLLVNLLTVASPEIRASAVFGLGCLVHSCPELDTSSQMDHPLNMTPTDDRLPAEQLIANAVRQVVYDPSVVVRCELAVLYARFVRGHASHVHEALQMHQKKLVDFVRTQHQQQQQQQLHHPSLSGSGSHSLVRRSVDSIPRSGILGVPGGAGAGGGGGSVASTDSFDGDRNSGNYGTRSSPDRRRSNTPPPPASALTPPTSSTHPTSTPTPHAANTQHSEALSSSSGSGSLSPFRSPSTYAALLESIQMLALDPSPKVAKMGREVLRISQYELSFVPQLTSVGGSSGFVNGTASPQRLGMPNALSSMTQSLRKRSWLPGSTTGQSTSVSNSGRFTPGAAGSSSTSAAVAAATATTASSTPMSGSPPSPLDFRDMLGFSRHPYMLTSTGARGTDLQLNHNHAFDATESIQEPSISHPPVSSPAAGAPPTNSSTISATSSLTPVIPIPASVVYNLSKEYFSRPMLEPQASAWSETEGVTLAPWIASVDLKRKVKRIEEIETGLTRCHALFSPKLREQVYSMETGSDAITAVCFHPYHPVVCISDSRGFIKVINYYDSSLANAFHAATGSPLSEQKALPTQVNFIRQLNEQDGPMLLCGSVDGAVRIWRNYTLKDSHHMATALQAVTIHLPPAHGHPTAYEWSQSRSLLFAAGGSHPEMVYCWDLHYEMCSNMIPMSAPGTAAPPCVERIVLGQTDPNLLIASCHDAVIRIFDVRNNRSPALMLQPFRQAATGVVFEPNGRPNIMVTASERGDMCFIDLRMASSSSPSATHNGVAGQGGSSDGVVRVVLAHSKGGLSALVAHSHAPLLASGTVNQIVKVWTDQGEAVGAIRAQSQLNSHKVGPVTCMSFHSYQPLLAAAGEDSICTVYAIDNNPMGGGSGSFNPAATSFASSAGVSRSTSVMPSVVLVSGSTTTSTPSFNSSSVGPSPQAPNATATVHPSAQASSSSSSSLTA